MATFHIQTFGCKVNQCDSQILRETLISWGLKEAGAREAAVVVINTCTVTGTADSKFRKAIRRAKRQNPHAFVIVTGCFAQRADCSSENEPETDLIFKIRDFRHLSDFLFRQGLIDSKTTKGKHRQSYFAEHTRAFLKIQDGCDRFCAYCVVPHVRPELWSEDEDNVIAAIHSLSSRGYKEVVLAGIHLGFYRRGEGENALARLLGRIEDECDVERVRLSSIEINEVSNQLLSIIADSKRFCRHLHVPLQSGDNDILARMNRGYSSDFFLRKVEEIRKRIPDVGISTDVIVGFPGETDKQVDRTMQLIEKIEFVRTHVFRFSPRPGTKAAEMDSHVPSRFVSSRARSMIQAGEAASRRFRERFVGRTVKVLAETYDHTEKSCMGLSSNYIRIKVLGVSSQCLNHTMSVRLAAAGMGSGVATGRLVGTTAHQGGLSYV